MIYNSTNDIYLFVSFPPQAYVLIQLKSTIVVVCQDDVVDVDVDDEDGVDVDDVVEVLTTNTNKTNID